MADRQPIHVTWQPRYEDWVEANRALRTIRHWVNQSLYVAIGLAFAVAGLVTNRTFYVVYGLAAAVAVVAYFQLVKPRIERKQIWNTSEANLHGAEAFIDLDKGPTFVYGPTTVALDWSAIERVRESEHQFILLPAGGRTMHILPKEPLLDSATVEAVRAILRERLADSDIQLRGPKTPGRASTAG